MSGGGPGDPPRRDLQNVAPDNIILTSFLIAPYFLLDKSRVAIWGWSYGGFVTASVLAKDADKNNIFQVDR